ncbi:arylsulfatase [Photobacterium profundum]|uniref:arylsulfatase n=1 Tax=Photobacterium profundum TaxID=74109 RepID=UPI003D12D831
MVNILKKSIVAATLATCGITSAYAAEQPNILVIFGDDIGYSNLSTYNQGMLGYQTPNIDSIANQGGKFTSYYAQQSCTAGRSAFITGQMPIRTGLTKVGLPGADQGLQPEDITMAQVLRDMGYATGQFGKNHLGDKEYMLPTNNGFDEFLGNLYHLNAEEEPENPDYPQDPAFREKFGPRGVIKSFADGRMEDTGPLTRKRMETIDDETLGAAMDFMERQVKADKPFFTWYNTTRMHVNTHVKNSNLGRTGLGFYADAMVEHDDQIGEILKKVDDLGIADNTIVVYTTDNGPMNATWPDASFGPFRGEKNTGWEGGFRVPALIKWPGHIKPGSLYNQMFAGEDWFPTLVSMAGKNDIKEQLLTSYTASNGRTYKNHLDGYNQQDYLTNKTDESAREEFFYWSDDGDLLALRDGRWKMHFKIQENEGWDVWTREFTNLRIPLIFDLEVDPYEKGDQGFGYDRWMFDRVFRLVPAQAKVAEMLKSFQEFPPRQEVASFSIDKIMEETMNASKAAEKAGLVQNN